MDSVLCQIQSAAAARGEIAALANVRSDPAKEAHRIRPLLAFFFWTHSGVRLLIRVQLVLASQCTVSEHLGRLRTFRDVLRNCARYIGQVHCHVVLRNRVVFCRVLLQYLIDVFVLVDGKLQCIAYDAFSIHQVTKDSTPESQLSQYLGLRMCCDN